MKKILVLLAFVVSGCASNPADEAPGPFPEDYKQLIKKEFRVYLKDPDSVKDLTIPPPHPYTVYMGIFHGNVSFYTTCITLNAKNSFGGYTGIQPMIVNIKNDEVLGMYNGCNYH